MDNFDGAVPKVYPKMNKKVNDRNVDKSMFLSFQFPVILLQKTVRQHRIIWDRELLSKKLIERGRGNLYREVPDITLTPS